MLRRSKMERAHIQGQRTGLGLVLEHHFSFTNSSLFRSNSVQIGSIQFYRAMKMHVLWLDSFMHVIQMHTYDTNVAKSLNKNNCRKFLRPGKCTYASSDRNACVGCTARARTCKAPSCEGNSTNSSNSSKHEKTLKILSGI